MVFYAFIGLDPWKVYRSDGTYPNSTALKFILSVMNSATLHAPPNYWFEKFILYSPKETEGAGQLKLIFLIL